MNINADYQNDLINFIFHKPGSRLALEQFPDVQRSLNIYRNNLFVNAARALAISFPTVESLMGKKAFRGLIAQVLQTEMKSQFDWAEYGQSFSRCIAEQEDLVEYPYLSEVADFDWVIHQIQREADKPHHADSFALLQQAPLDELFFDLSTGFGLREYWFPVGDLHRLVNDKSLSEAERQSLQKNTTLLIKHAINLDQPGSIIVWRPRFKANTETLNDAQQAAYKMLVEEQCVADIFAYLEQQNIDLVAWLSNVIGTQKVIGIVRKTK